MVKTQQDAENVRQQKKTVIWFVLFVWLNQTDQMNQINKTNQFDHPGVRVLLTRTWGPLDFLQTGLVFPQPVSRRN
jgi:hypothetical protein